MYKDKHICTAIETKFWGLFINNNPSCKTQIEIFLPKLGSACYAMQLVKPYVLVNTLKMICYYSFHSVMTYGLLFWGQSSDSIKIFRLQKKIIRIIMVCRSSDSCRKMFFNLETLPIPSQYIFLFFMIRNKG